MAKAQINPEAFKASEIAGYIRALIDSGQALEKRVKALEQKDRQTWNFPELPYGGDSQSLNTNHVVTLRVTSVTAGAGHFWGKRILLGNVASSDDTDATSPLKINVPTNASVPDLNDEVLAHFISAFALSGTTEEAKYWFPNHDNILVAKTTSRSWAYPTDPNTNVYEVQLYSPSFSATTGPGKQVFTLFPAATVLAGCWEGNCTLMPSGTYVLVFKTRGRYFFQKTQLTSLTVITSLRFNTTDLALQAQTRDVLVTVTTSASSDSWKTWTSVQSC